MLQKAAGYRFNRNLEKQGFGENFHAPAKSHLFQFAIQENVRFSEVTASALVSVIPDLVWDSAFSEMKIYLVSQYLTTTGMSWSYEPLETPLS